MIGSQQAIHVDPTLQDRLRARIPEGAELRSETSSAAGTDGTAEAVDNPIQRLMTTLEDRVGDRTGLHRAQVAVDTLENLTHQLREFAGLPADAREASVGALLDFATTLPDDREGYLVAAALLSSLGQAFQADAPNMAAQLSSEARRRLADLALQLDVAAPGALQALLAEADNLENYGYGRALDAWNAEANVGDIDFSKGPFADAGSATEGLQAAMGQAFLPARTAEDVQGAVEDAWRSTPDDERDPLVERIREGAQTDPLFALVLAIIQASENTQRDAADHLTNVNFTLNEQGLAGVQNELQKATKLLEMGMGILESLHALQDIVGRGWS